MKIVMLALLCAAELAAVGQQTRPTPTPRPGTIDTLDSVYSFKIVQLDQPVYPMAARTANIHGTVRMMFRLIGCQFDRNSVQVVSGNPILAREAMRSAQNSTIECDPSNLRANTKPTTTANLVYVFDIDRKCHNDKTSSRVMDNTVLVKACAAPPTP